MINKLAIHNQTNDNNNKTTIDKINNFIPICLTSLFIFTFNEIFKKFFKYFEGDSKYWLLNRLIFLFLILNLFFIYYLE